MEKNFRYCKKGHGDDSLTDHEIKELDIDFAIDIQNSHVITTLSKEEWKDVKFWRNVYRHGGRTR